MNKYPRDQVFWIIKRLQDRPDDLDEFAREFDELLDSPGPDLQDRVMEFLEDWMTSLRLQEDPRWQVQMETPPGRQKMHA